MNKRLVLLYLLPIFLLLNPGFSSSLIASDTYTWTGDGTDNEWTNPDNWENDGPNGVPDLPPSDADVIINGNFSVTLSAPANYTIESLHLKNGASLTIAVGATLNTRKGNTGNEGVTLDSGGALTLFGTLNINDLDSNLDIGLYVDDNGSAFIGSGGTLNIPDFGGTEDRPASIRVDGSLVNNGTVVITNPSYRGILMGGGGSATNNSSGSITVSGGVEGIYFRSNSSLTNDGLVNLYDASSRLVEGGSGWSFTNNGTLAGNGNMRTKYLSFGSGAVIAPGITLGNSTGTLILDNGSNDIDLDGVTLQIEINLPAAGTGYDQVRTSGSGDLYLAGSVLSLSGTYTPTAGDQFFLVTATGGGDIDGMFGGGPFTFNNVLLRDMTSGGLEFEASFPVELTAFIAKSNGQTVQLRWSTATETNNDYFSIEHSTDGRHFKEVGRLAGAGTIQEVQQYFFVDPSPVGGLNYYRLCQYDFDGSQEYSSVQAVVMDGKNTWTAWPTLARESVTIEWQDRPEANTVIEVFNLAGQKVYRQEVSFQDTRLEISIDNWLSGMYWVMMQQNGQVQAQRFVKE